MKLNKLFPCLRKRKYKELPPANTIIGQIERQRLKRLPALRLSHPIELVASIRLTELHELEASDNHAGFAKHKQWLKEAYGYQDCTEIFIRGARSTPEGAVKQFMNSPNHRAEIIRGKWTYYGLVYEPRIEHNREVWYCIVIFAC